MEADEGRRDSVNVVWLGGEMVMHGSSSRLGVSSKLLVALYWRLPPMSLT